jgi:cytochrome c-type biogenesis protein
MTWPDISVAILAGALAAFNPCGFALLPAYTAAFIKGAGDRPPVALALGRALMLAAGMGIGLLAVFGVFALALAPLHSIIESYLPYVTIVIGVGLVVLGVVAWMGGPGGLSRLRFFSITPGKSFWSVIGYGVTFALASLSCTIGPFLAVLSIGFRSDSWLAAPVLMSIYAGGMALSVFVVGAVVAVSPAGSAATLSRFRSISGRLISGLVIVVGAYVIWYGVYDLRLRSGVIAQDPLINAAITVQSFVAQTVAASGFFGLLFALGLVIVASVWAIRASRAKKASISDEHEVPHD